MDLERLKSLIEWMARSPLAELEFADGDFKVHLIKGDGGTVDVVEPDPACEGTIVAAPSYGIVHLASTPGAALLVSVGQSITAGQALCVVEAMKVFTTLEAEVAGTVAEILVADGAEVTAGQLLFRLE